MSEKTSLVSVCYDGRRVVTPWPQGARMSLARQLDQAERHRETVRDYLYVQNIERMNSDSWWKAA
jgi:hypothetical protein